MCKAHENMFLHKNSIIKPKKDPKKAKEHSGSTVVRHGLPCKAVGNKKDAENGDPDSERRGEGESETAVADVADVDTLSLSSWMRC